MDNTFFVSGMTCDACAKLIHMYVKRISGVQEVEVSREKGTLHIMSDRLITPEEIQVSLEKTPYRVTQ